MQAVAPNGTPLGAPDLVSLADIDIQPLDFIYLIRKRVEATGYAEIEARVRHKFARKFSLSDATIVKVGLQAAAPAPQCEIFRRDTSICKCNSRTHWYRASFDRSGFVAGSKTTTKPSDNPGNLDVPELQSRIAGIRSEFDALFATLDTTVTDAATLQTPATVDLLRLQLVEIANAGLTYSFPLSTTGAGDSERESLLSQGHSLQARYAELKASYDAKLAAVNAATTKPPQQVSLLAEMAKSFLGDEFVLLPKFL